MSEILLFVEDAAQEAFLTRVASRLIDQAGLKIKTRIRSAHGGSGSVLNSLKDYASAVKAGREISPDGLLVAVDANCHGYTRRRNELDEKAGELKHLIIHAIPDPHIERWLLLDSEAFKTAVGRGCRAPDEKCEKKRYKKLLAKSVAEAGIQPLLGGVEYAEDIAASIDIQGVCDRDDSFNRFISEFRIWLNGQRNR